jgi:hypothetical protein
MVTAAASVAEVVEIEGPERNEKFSEISKKPSKSSSPNHRTANAKILHELCLATDVLDVIV